VNTMTYDELNALVDNAIDHLLKSAEKDKQIADLQSQVATLKAAGSASDAEIELLQEKFAKLSDLLKSTQEPNPGQSA
jgi:predicted  nucleic acid-binding Zn-ribbon protein